MTKPDLHVFKNKVIDWVIAESIEDAREVVREQYGHDEFEPWSPAFEFTQLPDDEVLTVRSDDDDDGDEPESMTCREWAETGRGFLASTEF